MPNLQLLTPALLSQIPPPFFFLPVSFFSATVGLILTDQTGRFGVSLNKVTCSIAVCPAAVQPFMFADCC